MVEIPQKAIYVYNKMVKEYTTLRIQKKHAEIFKQIKNSSEDMRGLSDDAVFKLLMEKYVLEEDIIISYQEEQGEQENV